MKPWQVPELNWVLRKSGSRERSTSRREDSAQKMHWNKIIMQEEENVSSVPYITDGWRKQIP